MTNREIFNSLRTAKWEQHREGECIMKTGGQDWNAYVGPDGTLYVAGSAVIGGSFTMPHGIIPEVDEVVAFARAEVVNLWHEWLERDPLRDTSLMFPLVGLKSYATADASTVA